MGGGPWERPATVLERQNEKKASNPTMGRQGTEKRQNMFFSSSPYTAAHQTPSVSILPAAAALLT